MITGDKVVVTATGPSLTTHDLTRIKYPIIGVNESFLAVWPDWHCIQDRSQYELAPGVYRHLAKQQKLWSAPGIPVGIRTPYLMEGDRKTTPFSFDLTRGFVDGLESTGSTTYYALQVAFFLLRGTVDPLKGENHPGTKTIYILGLDLGPLDGRGHAVGGRPVDPNMPRMDGLFHYAARALKTQDVKVFNCGSPRSKCTAFPKCSFTEVAR